MSAQATPFGTLADGRLVRRVALAWPGGLSLEVIEYGASVRSLRAAAADGAPVETVLGFADLASYEADRSYQGRAVGRCANRIDHARFQIDGERFQVAANEGETCLHGGPGGFSDRLWRIETTAADGRSASLAYDSADGEEGFPGAVQARVHFALTAADTLEIEWEATASRACPVNLTHHLYFNLSGDPGRSMLDHSLRVAADAITPVRPDLIPTGALLNVTGTPFDLRQPRRLDEVLAEAHPQLAIGGGYDHNWVLRDGARDAAVLSCPTTGLSLHLATDQPGLQIYSGQGLTAPFAAHGGLALEPQGFPNAVNQPTFPNVVLRPGRAYRRWARYRFVADGEA